MPLPRFRLRTLMIAVAIVAVQFALLVSVPGSTLTILPFGPLVGIAWAFCRWRGQGYAYFRGGVWGGAIQAVPYTLFMAGHNVYEVVSGTSRIGDEWINIAFQLWFLPLVNVIVGAAVGLLAELGNLLVFLVTLPWRTIPTRSGNPPGSR